MGFGSYVAVSSNITRLLAHENDNYYSKSIIDRFKTNTVKQFNNRFIASIYLSCSFQIECDQCGKQYCVGCQENDIVLNIDTDTTTCVKCADTYVAKMKTVLLTR